MYTASKCEQYLIHLGRKKSILRCILKGHFIKKIANPYILIGSRSHFLLTKLKIKMGNMKERRKRKRKELFDH